MGWELGMHCKHFCKPWADRHYRQCQRASSLVVIGGRRGRNSLCHATRAIDSRKGSQGTPLRQTKGHVWQAALPSISYDGTPFVRRVRLPGRGTSTHLESLR